MPWARAVHVGWGSTHRSTPRSGPRGVAGRESAMDTTDLHLWGHVETRERSDAECPRRRSVTSSGTVYAFPCAQIGRGRGLTHR
eukprot:6893351-Prymnesium_polylepis.1